MIKLEDLVLLNEDTTDFNIIQPYQKSTSDFKISFDLSNEYPNLGLCVIYTKKTYNYMSLFVDIEIKSFPVYANVFDTIVKKYSKFILENNSTDFGTYHKLKTVDFYIGNVKLDPVDNMSPSEVNDIFNYNIKPEYDYRRKRRDVFLIDPEEVILDIEDLESFEQQKKLITKKIKTAYRVFKNGTIDINGEELKYSLSDDIQIMLSPHHLHGYNRHNKKIKNEDLTGRLYVNLKKTKFEKDGNVIYFEQFTDSNKHDKMNINDYVIFISKIKKIFEEHNIILEDKN